MDRLRPVVALVGGAASVVIGVLALASWTMDTAPPDTTVVAAPIATAANGVADGAFPTAEGGVLTMTGTAPGTLELTQVDRNFSAGGTGYTLEGPDGRLTLSGVTPLTVDHLVYRNHDFFLDPGDCTLTMGEVNTEVGIAEAFISCVEITDLRDTATLTVEGTLGISGALVERDDLPAVGGTVTVSGATDITWEVEGGDWWSYDADAFVPTPSPLQLTYAGGEPWEVGGVEISQDEEGTSLWVSGLFLPPETTIEIDPDECPAAFETLAVIAPDIEMRRVSMDCETGTADGGAIAIEGSIVVYHTVIGRP